MLETQAKGKSTTWYCKLDYMSDSPCVVQESMDDGIVNMTFITQVLDQETDSCVELYWREISIRQSHVEMILGVEHYKMVLIKEQINTCTYL